MDIFPITEQNKESGALRIRALKEKIDDEKYLYDAIQRIALVLSNEITGKGETNIRYFKERRS